MPCLLFCKKAGYMGGRGAGSNIKRGGPNDATEYYASGEGMWINSFLRGNPDMGELSQSEKEYLRDLDKATDGYLPDKTLYRSVDATAIFSGMDDTDYQNLYSVLAYGDNAFGKGSYAQGLVNKVHGQINSALGKTITEKGFMSTTSSRSVAENWQDFSGATKPIVMEIKTSKGTRGVNLSGYDKNVSPGDAQHERLLARGQSYKVNNIGLKNGNIYVEVTMK